MKQEAPVFKKEWHSHYIEHAAVPGGIFRFLADTCISKETLMGYRTILSSPLLLTIKNTSGNRVVVSGANVAPGKTRTVAGNVFVNDKYRAEELAALTRNHSIQVLLTGLGYINHVLSADQLAGLAATGVVPQGEVPQLATVDLPANTDVPVGFRVYDTTLVTFVSNDGSAWV